MKRLLSLVFIAFTVSSCGNSNSSNSTEAMKGYRECMSDKREGFAKIKVAYLECVSKGTGTGYCIPPLPFNDAMEQMTCQSEWDIKYVPR